MTEFERELLLEMRRQTAVLSEMNSALIMLCNIEKERMDTYEKCEEELSEPTEEYFKNFNDDYYE